MPDREWQVFFKHSRNFEAACAKNGPKISPIDTPYARLHEFVSKREYPMDRRRVIDPRNVELETWSQGSLYGGRDARLGHTLGLRHLGLGYSEVEPGKSGCPFHNHHVEDEVFIILEGEGTYRIGNERHPVKAGDILGAPAGGPETAHQLINSGSVTLRYIVVSTKAATEICEYPDSGKFLAKTLDPDTGSYRFNQMVSETESIDYWHGEPGA